MFQHKILYNGAEEKALPQSSRNENYLITQQIKHLIIHYFTALML
jgi:hypothetical protein